MLLLSGGVGDRRGRPTSSPRRSRSTTRGRPFIGHPPDVGVHRPGQVAGGPLRPTKKEQEHRQMDGEQAPGRRRGGCLGEQARCWLEPMT